MGAIKDAIDAAVRDFSTQGVKASGIHQVKKADVRAIGAMLDEGIANAALGSLVELVYSTRAELDADLAHNDGVVALVYGDAADANNDLYVKAGASGTGAWALTSAFHDAVSGLAQPFVSAAQEAANTANARTFDALTRLIGASQVYGYDIDPMPDAANAASASYFVFARPLTAEILLTTVSFNARATGTVKICIFDRDGDDFSLVDSTDIVVAAAGDQEHSILLRGSEGQYVGFYGPGIVEFESGTADSGGWYAGTTPNFTDASVTTTSRLFIRIEGGKLDRLEAIEALLNAATETVAAVIGQTGALVETANVTSTGINFVLAASAPANGTLSEIEFFAKTAHNLIVGIYERDGDTFTIVEQRQYAVPQGAQSLPLNIGIKAGQHVGFVSSQVCFQVSVQDPASAWYSGSGTSFVDATATTSTPLQFRATVEYQVAKDTTASRSRSVDLPFPKGLVIGAGQSLMEGSTTETNEVDPITIAQDDDNAAFPAYPLAPGELLPATVANTQRVGTRGEWPLLGMMSRLRDLLEIQNEVTYETVENMLVAINTAVGGQSITALKKGTAPYAAGVAAASRLVQIDRSAGVLAVCWGQGEQDAAGGMAEADYLAHIKQLARDYDADLRGATGQTKRIPLVTYQLTSGNYRRIGLVHLRASLESELIYLCCPMYPFTYYDSVHIDAESERLWGAYQARVIKRVVYDGDDWQPLRPVSCQVVGNSAVLTFNKAGLAFDTVTLPAQTNQGFKVLDEVDAVVAISAVTILNGNQVKVTCAEPIGDGFTIRYGDNAAVGRADSYTGGCGNLRDSAGDVESFDGMPLHNWSVLFDWEI